MTKDEVLEKCTIDGQTVRLPDVQLDRKLYLAVNKALQGIGGKWNRKAQGFVFVDTANIPKLLGRVQNGENVNLKKEFQFFPTPPALVKEMVSYLQLDDRVVGILEPSAGDGAILKELLKVADQDIFAIELMSENREILKQMDNVLLMQEPDFMNFKTSYQFDRIIANPPFTRNQDIDHVRKMYEHLRPGGRMVTLTSPSWTFGTQKKQVEFKNWLRNLPDWEHVSLPKGAFKSSGTMISTELLIINK